MSRCFRRWSRRSSSLLPGNAASSRISTTSPRLLEQAALGVQTTLPREMRALIEQFLAVGGDPDEAAAELRAFARDANIALDAVLDVFESRTGFLAARGVDV